MPQSDADLMEAPADRSQRSVVRTYERIAPVYDLLDAAYEWSWKKRLRGELFRHARGRILDVGVGTGCNIPHYPAGSEVVGIDSSQEMLKRAGQRARSLGRGMQLFEMNLLDLDLPDRSFDTVVVTFVMICLPERLQLPALRELRRVCRPDGAILLLDYRMSTNPAMRLGMRCLSPWLRWAFAARYDSSTESYIEPAGLYVAERRLFMQDSVSLLVLKPATATSGATSSNGASRANGSGNGI